MKKGLFPGGKKRGTLNESPGKGKEKPKNQQDKEMGRAMAITGEDLFLFCLNFSCGEILPHLAPQKNI
ncbi:MAG: hypothetical protein KKH22_01000 [Proteobacteria bacterium]|nr:hypothetical protein [Pseudomonadota bacterium]